MLLRSGLRYVWSMSFFFNVIKKKYKIVSNQLLLRVLQIFWKYGWKKKNASKNLTEYFMKIIHSSKQTHSTLTLRSINLLSFTPPVLGSHPYRIWCPLSSVLPLSRIFFKFFTRFSWTTHPLWSENKKCGTFPTQKAEIDTAVNRLGGNHYR